MTRLCKQKLNVTVIFSNQDRIKDYWRSLSRRNKRDIFSNSKTFTATNPCYSNPQTYSYSGGVEQEVQGLVQGAIIIPSVHSRTLSNKAKQLNWKEATGNIALRPTTCQCTRGPKMDNRGPLRVAVVSNWGTQRYIEWRQLGGNGGNWRGLRKGDDEA